MKNWIVAAIAIAMGVGVSATLLVLTNPSRNEVDVYALTRDVSAGDVIATDALRLEPGMARAGHASLFARGDGTLLAGVGAAHDLAGREPLQRGARPADGFVVGHRPL